VDGELVTYLLCLFYNRKKLDYYNLNTLKPEGILILSNFDIILLVNKIKTDFYIS